MSNGSDYLEQSIINHFFRNAAVTATATKYLALFTADPTDAGSGAEVSGGGYARQAITFTDPGSTSGATANSADISFTASGANFGTVTHIGVMDASTSGHLLWYAPMTVSRAVNDGDTLKFVTGNVALTVV